MKRGGKEGDGTDRVDNGGGHQRRQYMKEEAMVYHTVKKEGGKI